MDILFVYDKNLSGHAHAMGRYCDAARRLDLRVDEEAVSQEEWTAAPEGIAGVNEVVVQSFIPPVMRPLGRRFNIAVLYHEWDRVPTAWVAALEEFDQVWVSSRYLRDVLKQSGFRHEPLYVPVPFDTSAIETKKNWEAHKPFRFLSVGEWHFRKGYHLLADAFTRAFPREGEAVLTIKTTPGVDFRFDNPSIRIIADRLSDREMQELITTSDAYVTTSLAEGLGMPVGEAMAAGLPVLAPNWSGLTEFCADGLCLQLPFTVHPQPFCSRPDYYAPGQQCAIIDGGACTSAMKAVVEMKAAERKKLAAAALASLENRFSMEIASKEISAVLQNIQKNG